MTAAPRGEADASFASLAARAEDAPEVAYGAAVAWHERGIGRESATGAGKSKHEFIKGEVLALVEAKLYAEALEAIARFGFDNGLPRTPRREDREDVSLSPYGNCNVRMSRLIQRASGVQAPTLQPKKCLMGAEVHRTCGKPPKVLCLSEAAVLLRSCRKPLVMAPPFFSFYKSAALTAGKAGASRGCRNISTQCKDYLSLSGIDFQSTRCARCRLHQ